MTEINEITDNIGGLCKACMGLYQKMAEMTRKAAEKVRMRAFLERDYSIGCDE